MLEPRSRKFLADCYIIWVLLQEEEARYEYAVDYWFIFCWMYYSATGLGGDFIGVAG